MLEKHDLIDRTCNKMSRFFKYHYYIAKFIELLN